MAEASATDPNPFDIAPIVVPPWWAVAMTQHDKAVLFRGLHTADRVLVLPNAWDVASARLVEQAGAAAVATTSSGVSWSLGAPDGDKLGRDLAAEAVARIAAAVEVPVSADIEGGYADGPAGVAETVKAVLAAGAVGINLEDADRSVPDQVERIAAARRAADETGVPMFLNARIDTYLLSAGGLDETLARAEAFLRAGADGIFVPGVVDPETVAALAKAVPAPLNILAGPGAPAIGELQRLGVARVSLGGRIAEAAYALTRRAAQEVLTAGTYTTIEGGLSYGELNALLST